MRSAPEYDREQLRQVLIHRRGNIYLRIRELRRIQEIEAEPPPADSIEAARATADIETHAGLIGNAEDELALIDEALAKLESGTYGICEDCGDDISASRLRAVPATRYCLNCQDRQTALQRRRAEGTIIGPYDHLWAVPQEMREAREVRVRTDAARRSIRYEEAPPANLPQPVKIIFSRTRSDTRRRHK